MRNRGGSSWAGVAVGPGHVLVLVALVAPVVLAALSPFVIFMAGVAGSPRP